MQTLLRVPLVSVLTKFHCILVHVFWFKTHEKPGFFSNVAVDPCETYLCLNGGICVNMLEQGPSCKCQERFFGRYCGTYKAGKEINSRVFVA